MLQHTNTVDSKTGEITELWRMATWCHTIADLHIKRTFGCGKCEQSLTTPLNTSSFIIKAAFFQFHPLWQHVDWPLVEVKPEVGRVVVRFPDPHYVVGRENEPLWDGAVFFRGP